jgi:ABC-type sugar transport system ATPase subunit
LIQENLSLEHISKSFGGIKALDDINLEFRTGAIYGLAGENGAGKSTTMKIINGAYTADSGNILIDGRKVQFSSPLDAQNSGIGMVYQELNMLPDLDVAENVLISNLTDNKFGYINKKKLHEKTRNLLKMMNIDIDTHTRLGELKVAYQQLIAIVRALSRNCRLVIMDEPTSALAERDGKYVINAARRLKELGYIVIYISHKLNEILEVTDEVIVFRNGMKIGQFKSGELTEASLAELIAGRKLKAKFPKIQFRRGPELMRFENLSVDGLLNDISFALYSGEILGVAGLLGSGKTEMARSLFGVYSRGKPKMRGNFYLEGEKIDLKTPSGAIRKKIGLVPENRATEGLVTEMSIEDNIIMPTMDKVSRAGWISSGKVSGVVKDMVEKLRVKCGAVRSLVSTLSGGNQQKVVLAKWIAAGARIIIFDEPTRGIDVGAKVTFYEIMNELVNEGIGVMIMSSELDEVYNMSDRIIVLKEGSIVDVFETSAISMADLQKCM